MSQRMPDYEDLRARQARAQESIVTAQEDIAGRTCGCLPDESCPWCSPCQDTAGCVRRNKHKSKCAVRG